MGAGTVPDAEPRTALDPSLPPQGYRLRAGVDGITLDGADEAGLFYGRATLEQLRRIGLPAVEISDHPDVAVRGVMLDVSRDKVPTLDTLKALVDRLASWKINHLQLYTEHTFAYAGHEQVWASASAYTPDEIRELDGYCRERHVELAPNQNCLGHMERWLRHPRYRELSASEEGWLDPWGRRHPVSTLDPSDPGTIELVADLLGQLVPCFSSGRVHVGLDEPYGLDEARMEEYLAHVARVRALPALSGREMLMWGEVLYHRPELLERVPPDVALCVWGYEGNFPFERLVERVRAAGLPWWVCPGTSTWLNLTGRIPNMRANVEAAAAAASGAGGFMVCDWGDYGHLQYLPVSEPALAYAAGASWCVETNRDIELASAVDVHAFGDTAGELGAALSELGSLYTHVTPYVPNSSALVFHLYYPEVPVGRGSTEGLTVEELRDVQERLGTIRERLSRARPARPDGSLVVDELRTTCALVSLLCRDAIARLEGDGTLASVPDPRRGGLAEDLQPIIERHAAHWLARNRPGGLSDSRARLENLHRAYLGG